MVAANVSLTHVPPAGDHTFVFLVFFQNPWSLPLFVKMHRASHWLYKKLLHHIVLKTDVLIR